MKNYLLFISLLVVSLTACTPYTIPIEQGNILKPEMIEQLEIGMSKSQVEYVLGTPVIKDTFNTNRWDYVYTLKVSKGHLLQKNLTVFFENDHVSSFSGKDTDNSDITEKKAD